MEVVIAFLRWIEKSTYLYTYLIAEYPFSFTGLARDPMTNTQNLSLKRKNVAKMEKTIENIMHIGTH